MVCLNVVEAGLDASLLDNERSLEVSAEELRLGALALPVLGGQPAEIVVQLCGQGSCRSLLV